MRLHQLTITAFGPFPGTVEVDFDALAAGGVFLLAGATGAGKSSVLDAVCFALYGQVPGDRGGAKHLHSDHAPADRAPRVTLELTVGVRRLRFSRSPAWTRPKRRGTGTTSVPAHVVVEEQRNGAWGGLTNRLDDAGLLVGDLLGMTCGQFTQVAMLPQGHFQAFLRASSSDRHAVLQQLFRTDRFERVEKWLAERRTADRRASEGAGHDVRDVLRRLEESSGTEAPVAWSETLVLAAEQGEVHAWSRDLAEAVTAELTVAEADLADAEVVEAAARESLAEARARATQTRRARTAAADLAELAHQAYALAEAGSALERHRTASALRPLVVRLQTTEEARRAAEHDWIRRLVAVTELPDVALPADPTPKDLAAARKRTASALAAADAFLPREAELHDGERLLRQTRTALVQVETERTAAESDLATLPALLAAAEGRRERTTAAAHQLAGVRASVMQLQELVSASKRLDRVSAELETAREDLRTATDVALAAKEHYLEVRESRINGMAAELAGDLAAGCGCPVCGSLVHPAPAFGRSAAVGDEQETAAERASVDADFARQNHQVKVAGLESEQTTLTERLAGHDRSALAATHAETRAHADALAADADLADAAEQAVADLRTTLTETTARVEGLRVREVALRAEVDERDATLAGLRDARLALLGDRADDIPALVAIRARTLDALDHATADRDALTLAARAAEDAATALLTAAHESGFADTRAALAALLDEDEADRVSRKITDAERRRIAAEATLADPEVREAAESGAPDLEALAAAHEVAASALRETATRATTLRRRRQRLAHLDTRLDERLAAWSPLRDRHRLSAELAMLAEGTSRDNPLKMRLSAYVLAERLRQVVAAANEQLGRMTGDRYALEHVADRGVGELRGGLSLRIRDDWNGVHRDPATLSGGETFVVSLALALGLADTVAHEAGGTDIDTLFIDEGFGSLDPDTLEDVMDTLDALRDGGRVVGLVSHVPELRNRITTQLEVLKGRNGSTLRPVLAAN